ncbi:MAG: glutathione S-transferase [Porticoccaceae bacterium]|nr:glutathione S-transferase [Porticoccaceae bacterium]
MPTKLPILYSFRRCPYAMRARMALLYASINPELREVLLKAKPEKMLAISGKGTVPVLELPDGRVLDESYEIIRWALEKSDPEHWWSADLAAAIDDLISRNDDQFKTDLDHYKYWQRFPAESQEQYRTRGERFLAELELLLAKQPYLLAERITLADIALFPFIRQFASVDRDWFDQSPYPKLRAWLNQLLESPLFLAAMKKSPPWQDGDSVMIL